MKNLILTAALAAGMACIAASCDNVDEYVAPAPYAIDWTAAADSSTTAFIQNFWNPERGFFNASSFGYNQETNNYWPQAHAMNVVISAYERTSDPKYSEMFDKWFEGIKVQCWSNRKNEYWVPLYDDNSWISLTMMRLYKITGDRKYLDVAAHLFDDMVANGTNELLGGLSWGVPSQYGADELATCTNGPAGLLGFKLYEATGDQKYADAAMKIYSYLREYILDPATGRVLNGINARTLESNGESASLYSYTHATVMAQAYAAYKLTGDELYLKDARRIAQYIVTQVCPDSSTGALFFENKNWRWDDSSGDTTLFRAVMFPYLAEIIEAPEIAPEWRDKFFAAINVTAELTWRNGLLDKSSYSNMLYNSNLTKGVEIGKEGYLNPNVTGASLIEMRARLKKSIGR